MEIFIFVALLLIAGAISATLLFKRKKPTPALPDDALERFSPLDWGAGFVAAAAEELRNARWLDREFREAWRQSRPKGPSPTSSEIRKWARQNKLPSFEARALVGIWGGGVNDYCAAQNEDFLKQELSEYTAFFSSIEEAPLTDEQMIACINMENRLQVVAAAGSGKTSVMVAKAAYALQRGLVAPERILLLAFNRSAALELQQRIDSRLSRAQLDSSQIQVATFHAFGLDVIGRASGKKPRLAPWAEDGQKMTKSESIIKKLLWTQPIFAVRWNLLRLVFTNDLPLIGEPDPVNYWRASDGKTGFLTLGNDVVKSSEEKALADWLFLHGVEYTYEAPYAFDVADAEHSQYRPDFFYPAAGLYHEHFALDDQGKAPESFVGYMEGVEWKRRLHKDYGTKLFETTSAQIRTGEAFEKLERKLKKLGVACEFDSNRSFPGRKPLDDRLLLGTMLTFLTHFKSSNLSEQTVRQRLMGDGSRENRLRHTLFADCFFPFFQQWQSELEQEGAVDFDDMLQKASDYLHAQPSLREFDLILVDEFQDTSIARMDLVRNLSNRAGIKVTAVGDDWQSINRFAGADVSVTKGFAQYFGESDTLGLTRTFRSPQQICDVSSKFVMKNPSQIVKGLRGLPNVRPHHISVLIVPEQQSRTEASNERWDAVLKTLDELADGVASPSVKESVVVLGRYRFELDKRPNVDKFGHRLNIGWYTIHSSKGREADHIIVVGLNSHERYGFPSRMEDDRVLNLVMPGIEDYPHAEERRLFYVALTRAKKTVTLVADASNPSAFLSELQSDYGILFRNLAGAGIDYRLCPRCGSGMKERTNSSTQVKFLGCSRFPDCRHTEAIGEKLLTQD